jgi:hypothetical protein
MDAGDGIVLDDISRPAETPDVSRRTTLDREAWG